MSVSSKSRQALRALLSLGVALQVLAPAVSSPAYAASVSSAAFTGGSDTVSVGGTLYAKNGGALTLTVNTSADTKCVQVTGAFTARQTSNTAKSSWTFNFTAGAGEGVQTVSAAASAGFNANNCTGQSQNPQSASYVLDNTGPVVKAAVSPAPNAAGWNNANVSITWSATDAGSGVASGPTPATDTQTANYRIEDKTATAIDRLGNKGTGTVTVKIDKSSPTIVGTASPSPNAHGWNNTDVMVSFTCDDPVDAQTKGSGIKSCTGSSTLTSTPADGTTVSGTAVDNADNSSSTTVGPIKIDKVPPTLSGAPGAGPNAAGWYNGDVTVHWTASDALSGLAGSAPVDSTISSEGTGLTASASVSDNAGNTTNATSTPAVNIDKTAPNTTATAPTNWNNADVTVSLKASDALSGVAATYYTVDGGAQQSGISIPISAEGDHTLQFWSVDNAGNTETAKSVHVKIDKTPPTINHTQAPAANGNGWNNTDVTVTFTCADAVSGIASCTTPQAITTEGRNQAVTGTATDNAGHSATDPATVSIDKTAPTISAAVDRTPNANGWYKAPVTVTFTCGDGLSGIDSCPAAATLGEGAAQNASGTAIDAAGNPASASASGISIDQTPPTLTGAATTAPNGNNGWYTTDVTVHWTASDMLSGLAGSAPTDSIIAGEGDDLSASASVSDLAGNSASSTVSGIKIDRTAPSTLVEVPDPLPGGWYAGAVQVTLNATDSLSGVAATYYRVDDGAPLVYQGPFSHSLGGAHTITFWSMDKAGLVEDSTLPGHTRTLQIDDIPPTISGSASPAPVNGWNTGQVIVTFNCDDNESGVASCAADGTSPTSPSKSLTSEGANQSVSGTATDKAGNTTQATVGGINIDSTPPVVTLTGITDKATYPLGSPVPSANCNSNDALSGVQTPATLSLSGTGTQPSGVGSFTATCSGAADVAGNLQTSPVSATYNVVYGSAFGGILQPVNADGSSRFKLGSTVPVKFRLMSGSTPITNAVAKLAVNQTDTAPDPGVDEAISTSAATTGNLFRYDATGQQYIFNLSTKSGFTGADGKTIAFTPGTWTLWILLDDGTSQSVKIQLVK